MCEKRPRQLLVTAGEVVASVDQDGTVHSLSDGGVLISDGQVAAVGHADDLRHAYPDAPTIGGRDVIAVPGFVNGHHHSGLTPVQLGVAPESLEVWSPTLVKAPPVDPYLDTLVSGLEMLRSGVTTVQHLTSVHDDPSSDSDDLILRAYTDLGMRVSYSVGVLDQNRLFLDQQESIVAGLPAPFDVEIARWLAATRVPAAEQLQRGYYDLKARWDGGAAGRIRIQLAPTNLHWCSDEALQLVSAASEADDVPMHMHLLETPYQRVYGFRRSPRGAVGHLADLNVLSRRLTIGHGVHVDDEDMGVLAEHDVSVCHNPSSNLRMKSGIAPVTRYLNRGIRVAIGIDEAGLADDRDMLLEMKLAYNLHRRPGTATRVPTTGEVLAMATSNGAGTTPYGDAVGQLTPGANADLVLVDRRRLAGAYLSGTVPVQDALVHRGRPQHIRTVLVNGEIVVDDGAVVTVNEDDLFTEIRARMAVAWPGRKDAERRADVLADAARRYYAGWQI